MKIKEHIEAGHYPADDKGRALVPMKSGGIVTIVWLNCYGIWGVPHADGAPVSWRDDGEYCGPYFNCRTDDSFDLLPPAPRKVKVAKWAVFQKDGCCWGFYPTAKKAGEWALERNGFVVELTGEYEEPWS